MNVAEWTSEVREFFAETLEELRSMIDVIDNTFDPNGTSQDAASFPTSIEHHSRGDLARAKQDGSPETVGKSCPGVETVESQTRLETLKRQLAERLQDGGWHARNTDEPV